MVRRFKLFTVLFVIHLSKEQDVHIQAVSSCARIFSSVELSRQSREPKYSQLQIVPASKN